SGRGGVAERKIQPLLRDQCLAGQFGPLRQNLRAIPRAVLARLAAHRFQPDLVGKSHWTAGKVGVRAHRAWDNEVFTRDLGWSLFQCVAVPRVAQKSEMAVGPDRVADGHKPFISERFDCVPGRIVLAAKKMLEQPPLHATCWEWRNCRHASFSAAAAALSA